MKLKKNKKKMTFILPKVAFYGIIYMNIYYEKKTQIVNLSC